MLKELKPDTDGTGPLLPGAAAVPELAVPTEPTPWQLSKSKRHRTLRPPPWWLLSCPSLAAVCGAATAPGWAGAAAGWSEPLPRADCSARTQARSSFCTIS